MPSKEPKAYTRRSCPFQEYIEYAKGKLKRQKKQKQLAKEGLDYVSGREKTVVTEP
jgi:hypothetical protein